MYNWRLHCTPLTACGIPVGRNDQWPSTVRHCPDYFMINSICKRAFYDDGDVYDSDLSDVENDEIEITPKRSDRKLCRVERD